MSKYDFLEYFLLTDILIEIDFLMRFKSKSRAKLDIYQKPDKLSAMNSNLSGNFVKYFYYFYSIYFKLFSSRKIMLPNRQQCLSAFTPLGRSNLRIVIIQCTIRRINSIESLACGLERGRGWLQIKLTVIHRCELAFLENDFRDG